MKMSSASCHMPSFLIASRTAHGVSDHEQKSSHGAAIRRRHQSSSSPQLTITTMSRTSQRRFVSKQHGSQEQLAAIMRSAATIDERTDGPDGRPIGGQWSWRHCSARRAIRERGLISKF